MDKNTKIAAYGIATFLGIGLIYLVSKPKTDKTSLPYDPVTNPNGGNSFNAEKIALGLYNAMRKIGTNEAAIFQILTPINQQQFGLVAKAFGKRQYNTVTGNQYSYLPGYNLDFYNLQEWLYYELSAEKYSTLRQKYPNYL
jgi:hypothetical protein